MEETTYLASAKDAPLTPPPTAEKQAYDPSYILQQYEKARSGKATETTFHIPRKVWKSVAHILLRDDKLRCDYFPSSERLVLRMPYQVHERFCQRLTKRIDAQLCLLADESGSAADFAKDIEDNGSTTIEPRDPKYGTHSPDGSFQHLESPLPTVIIEIAYSQQGRKLHTLAEDYIFGSNLEIRVVVTVDIEYRRHKGATFSVWRAKLQDPDNEIWTVEPAIANRVFRHEDGRPNDQKDLGLTLRLEDFADPRTCRRFNDINREIFVSCEELYKYLERAETVAKSAEPTEPERNPRLTKRCRTSSPEDQLADADEDAFIEDEERVAKRCHLDDASYAASPSD